MPDTGSASSGGMVVAHGGSIADFEWSISIDQTHMHH
jgi:hypothetical protein